MPKEAERISHGSPTFFIRGKKTVVNFHDDHHGDGCIAPWFSAPPGAQHELVSQEPERIFVPPFVGTRGWAGVRLDLAVD